MVHWVIMLGSVALYFIVTLAYSAICVTCNPPSNPYWILQRQMADPMFYLICIISTVVALLPRYQLPHPAHIFHSFSLAGNSVLMWSCHHCNRLFSEDDSSMLSRPTSLPHTICLMFYLL